MTSLSLSTLINSNGLGSCEPGIVEEDQQYKCFTLCSAVHGVYIGLLFFLVSHDSLHSLNDWTMLKNGALSYY